MLFGFKIDLSIKSPTNFNPFNKVLSSYTWSSISIKKFGITKHHRKTFKPIHNILSPK